LVKFTAEDYATVSFPTLETCRSKLGWKIEHDLAFVPTEQLAM